MFAGYASYQATGFDGESRFFPIVVAIALTLTGVTLLARAMFVHRAAADTKFNYTSVCIAAIVIAVWAAAFSSGLGFVLPTFFMQALLLWVTGQRRPIRIFLIAASVTALAYGLFVVLLDVPMPASILPDAMQGY